MKIYIMNDTTNPKMQVCVGIPCVISTKDEHVKGMFLRGGEFSTSRIENIEKTGPNNQIVTVETRNSKYEFIEIGSMEVTNDWTLKCKNIDGDILITSNRQMAHKFFE